MLKDYTKMDGASKKLGTKKRWDFDGEDQYADYMGKKVCDCSMCQRF